ncbi:hypothetical protein [Lacicoccus alkaliphilus]|uniref:ABC-type polysaccharide/polyol phosphate export permease n=1 Tax=Lacicoccus alkaliphilus DSM 16010 TaxID=1123231 RepID=A0A1M7KAD3_9BACL|nr:hypothetical protein [Salinicoccus alkaliphilus]SHM62252.1 ABC-type polysaccharide/polyol phosphate export permease [Salinicoccus alkaliphilus DSM 16010]
MKKKINYLSREFFRQVEEFKTHNLTPLLMYLICAVFLLAGVLTLSYADIIRYLYLVIGLMAAVWLFSMVVLNRNILFIKDSVVKIRYVPIFYRIMPVILFQTFTFTIFVTVNASIVALSVNDWMVNFFTMLYYIVLGVLLIIPFILFYLFVNSPDYRFNVAVFVVLILVIPIIYLPEQLSSGLESMLSLNPFYYVVNGLQTNAVNIAWNINRLPHDVLFFSQMALLYLWVFKLYDKMKFSFYDFNKKHQTRRNVE